MFNAMSRYFTLGIIDFINNPPIANPYFKKSLPLISKRRVRNLVKILARA